MRKAICLTVLALAACDENTGWNPNYVISDRPYGAEFDSRTPYAAYKVEREKALTGKRDTPAVIPVARPFEAPTAAQIAGPTLWQIIQRDARRVTAGAGAPAAPVKGGYVAPVVVEQPAAVVARPVTAVRGPYPDAGPVLARYAQGVTHQPGTVLWPRSGADANRALRTCRTYADADAAQVAFLAAGGPQVDPAGLDPDGDGFVCGWTPDRWRRGAGL